MAQLGYPSFQVTAAGESIGVPTRPSDRTGSSHVMAARLEPGGLPAAPRTGSMSATWARAWLRASAAAVAEQRIWLTDLDAAIGDGDHGINLDRGMRRVLEVLDDAETAALPAGELLESAGRVIMGSVGGASGALYGRALQRVGAALTAEAAATAAIRPPHATDGLPAVAGGQQTGSGNDPGGDARTGLGDDPGDRVRVLALAFDAAVEAIAALGRAAPGDKTMLDTLVPASLALHRSMNEGDDLATALSRAAEAATLGMETTTPLVARRGRASYLGERSAGHLDPGAASSLLLVRALVSTYPGLPRERRLPGD